MGALRISCAVPPCSVTSPLSHRMYFGGAPARSALRRPCASEERPGGLAGPRMPLRGVLSHSEGLRASQWAPGAPALSEALRMAQTASAPAGLRCRPGPRMAERPERLPSS